MKRWIKRWNMLNQRDRYRILILGLATVIAAYSFLIYPKSEKALMHSDNMIKRRLDRISKRAQIDKKVDSSNPTGLSRKLIKLEKELELAEARLANNMARFAPIDSAKAQQRLRLEISTLAQRSGLRVKKSNRLGLKKASIQTARRNPEETPIPAVKNPYGRPLLEVRGESSYWSLLKFLESLKNLTYHVSVVRLHAVVNQPASSKPDRWAVQPSNQLSIHLVLTL